MTACLYSRIYGCVSSKLWKQAGKNTGGTAAAVPPPLRLGDPALCGSRPLVTLC